MAQRALARHYNVALMGARWTRVFPAAVNICAEEVNTGVGTCRVDVVVLGEITHDGGGVLLIRGEGCW